MEVILMSLIQCPECGKEISDKAEQCIHCGFPLNDLKSKKLYYMTITGFKKNANKLSAELYLYQDYGISKEKAKYVIKNPGTPTIDGIFEENIVVLKQEFERLGCILEFNECKGNIANPLNEKLSRIREKREAKALCPRCKSDQITSSKRGFSVVTGFIGSNKTVNRCAKCGHSWKP